MYTDYNQALEHISWLVDTGERITTNDGKTIEVWEFQYKEDRSILSAWAKHFRNHYCLDHEIDELRDGTGLNRVDYLSNIVFPDKSQAPGPSIRAGDFAEILIADYLEFILKYWVPRFRYDNKSIRNESSKGTDILGFKFISKKESIEDILITFEVKAKLTGTEENKLQTAIEDSIKDCYTRKALSLNALKRRYIREGNHEEAKKIERFQNIADHPYTDLSGACAIFSTSLFNRVTLARADTSSHPNNNQLSLLVVHGNELMPLVHELYRRAADEA